MQEVLELQLPTVLREQANVRMHTEFFPASVGGLKEMGIQALPEAELLENTIWHQPQRSFREKACGFSVQGNSQALTTTFV